MKTRTAGDQEEGGGGGRGVIKGGGLMEISEIILPFS